MGLMNSMRNRAGLLIGAIGFAIVAFLVSDAIQSGSPFLQESRNEVGEVGDESISFQQFDEKLRTTTENLKNQINASSLDPQMMNYAVDQTWTQMVNDIVLNKQLQTLGISVGGDELFDMVQGNDPHPEVRKAFTDPQTGVFNPVLVLNFLKTMDERDPTGAARKQWLTFEKSIKEQRVRQKYFGLIKGGVYVTKLDAADDFTGKNKVADLKYVLLDYFSVPDSSLEVSESEVKDYYNENKKKYQQKEEERDFNYVVFDATPSADDSANAKAYVEELIANFKSSSNDSLFVALNADTKVEPTFAKKGSISPVLDTNLYNAAVGTIYGPFIEGNSFKIAKLVAVRNYPDSVRARHILIKPVNGNIEGARAKADSLKKAIKSGGSFAELAKTQSEDQGSGSKGGDLGYFSQQTMVKPFADACFNGSKGDMPIVESQFGIHLIEVMDQKNTSKAVKIAVIDRSINASTRTVQSAYAKANAFLAKVTAEGEFDKTVTTEGLNKRLAEKIKENDKFLAGLENPREMIRWAYKSEEGDISPLFEIADKFAIAQLSKIKEKGDIPLEDMKAQLEALTKKEKKSKMMVEKMAGYASGATNIDAAAAKAGIPAQLATGVTFASAVIPGLAREQYVIGAAFGIPVKKLSKPLEGERGVYLLEVQAVNDTLAAPESINFNKVQVLNSVRQRVESQSIEVLKDKVGVKDYRAKFY